jgi:hypothetical protein
LREQFDQSRGWLESVAERLAGRKTVVTAVQGPSPLATSAAQGASSQQADSTQDSSTPASTASPAKRDLKAEAMSSSTVQAALDVFPGEIRDVEEM